MILACAQTLSDPTLSDADRALALWTRGWLYYRDDKNQEALVDFDAAIAHIPAPDLVEVFNRFVARTVGPSDPAKEEDGDQAYDLVRPYGDFHIGRASALVRLGRLDEAAKAAADAEGEFRSKGYDGYAQGVRADIYERMGQFDEAEKLYRQAVALGDVYGRSPYRLALLLIASGKQSDVRGLLESALQHYPRRTQAILLLYALKLIPAAQADELWADAFLTADAPSPVLGQLKAYATGKIDEEELLHQVSSAAGTSDTSRMRFVLGAEALWTGDGQGARRQFEAGAAACAEESDECAALTAALWYLKSQ